MVLTLRNRSDAHESAPASTEELERCRLNQSEEMLSVLTQHSTFGGPRGLDNSGFRVPWNREQVATVLKDFKTQCQEHSDYKVMGTAMYDLVKNRTNDVELLRNMVLSKVVRALTGDNTEDDLHDLFDLW